MLYCKLVFITIIVFLCRLFWNSYTRLLQNVCRWRTVLIAILRFLSSERENVITNSGIGEKCCGLIGCILASLPVEGVMGTTIDLLVTLVQMCHLPFQWSLYTQHMICITNPVVIYATIIHLLCGVHSWSNLGMSYVYGVHRDQNLRWCNNWKVYPPEDHCLCLSISKIISHTHGNFPTHVHHSRIIHNIINCPNC